MTALTVEMLPAAQGDALWLEWEGTDRRYHVLIDGGPARSYPVLRDRVAAFRSAHDTIDLMVVTHIDTDHIDGAVTLLLDGDLGISFGDIWFNGRNHAHHPRSPAAGNSYLGGVQGQILSAILELPRFAWNAAFGGRAIVSDAGVDFPEVPLGGLTFTILSPGADQLTALARAWDRDVAGALAKLELIPEDGDEQEMVEALRAGGVELAARLLASRYGKRVAPPPEWVPPPDDDLRYLGDASKPNGSSIAVLVEDDARELAVLLTGDAHARVLLDAVNRLVTRRNQTRLRLDALKLPHHGSRHNVTPGLLAALDCDTFLFSTDGSHGFDHPDDETIGWILAEAARRGRVPALYFNYLSDRTEPWAAAEAGNGSRYTAHYPPEGRGEHGLAVRL